jgi:hypothetical protein
MSLQLHGCVIGLSNSLPSYEDTEFLGAPVCYPGIYLVSVYCVYTSYFLQRSWSFGKEVTANKRTWASVC